MPNQNNLIQAPFALYLLSSNFQNWFYKEIKKDDSLIILKELDLTITDVTAGDAAAHAAAVTARAADGGAIAYWKLYDQIQEEFIKTGKIKGHEMLNLRSMDRLWISHYDFNAVDIWF